MPTDPPARAGSPRITVLINAVHTKSGGGLTYLRNILPLLAASGEFDLHVAVQRDQAALFAEFVGPVPLHLLPSRPASVTVLIQEQTAIPRLARKLGAALVFSTANYGPVTGVPSVIVLGNSFGVGAIERRLGKRLYWAAVKLLSRLSFRACLVAITVSHHARAGFLAAFGSSEESRLAVVHHGVSPLFSPPGDEAVRIRHRLLAVSDLYVQKNLETAIAALATLRRTVPDIGLDIAGRPLDPEYFAALRRLAQELGVADRVTFLGHRSPAEVAKLYRTADVFVFPSRVETFGMPVLEAMASGLPVVCAQAAAMPEVAGDAALFAPPGDVDGWTAAIGRLLADRALWRSMAERGLARAAGFTWDDAARETARLLKSAAERGRDDEH